MGAYTDPEPRCPDGECNYEMLEWFSDYAYALMRIMAGFMFSFHGAQIVFGYSLISGRRCVPDLGRRDHRTGGRAGGDARVFKPALPLFSAAETMAVAYFQFHWKFSNGT